MTLESTKFHNKEATAYPSHKSEVAIQVMGYLKRKTGTQTLPAQNWNGKRTEKGNKSNTIQYYREKIAEGIP